MDKFGRAGKSIYLKPAYTGTNTGTTQDEKVDPSAQFVAGMVAHKDGTSGLVRAAIGDAVNAEDQPGQALGLLGLSKFDRPALHAVNEVQIASTDVRLDNSLVFDGSAPATWAQPTIFNVTTDAQVPKAQVDVIVAAATELTTRGILGDVTGAAAITAGDTLAISYYYRPLQEDKLALGLDETAPEGAVTVWKNQGQYELLAYERVDSTGADGLPALNDLLYVGPNGLLTAAPRNATAEVIAVCRRAPTVDNPYILIDLRI